VIYVPWLFEEEIHHGGTEDTEKDGAAPRRDLTGAEAGFILSG
jgi:hypothetical protein